MKIDPTDIRVCEGFSRAPRKAGKGAGGVGADAGQGFQGFYVFWEFSIVVFYNMFRGFFEVFRAAPVSQTFPDV